MRYIELQMFCLVTVMGALSLGFLYLLDWSECNSIHKQTGLPVMVQIGGFGCYALQDGRWEKGWRITRTVKP